MRNDVFASISERGAHTIHNGHAAIVPIIRVELILTQQSRNWQPAHVLHKRIRVRHHNLKVPVYANLSHAPALNPRLYHVSNFRPHEFVVHQIRAKNQRLNPPIVRATHPIPQLLLIVNPRQIKEHVRIVLVRHAVNPVHKLRTKFLYIMLVQIECLYKLIIQRQRVFRRFGRIL